MTHYDVLGVARTAPAAELRRAYVALAQRHHPDRPGGDAARMRAVNEAWATLGDPVRRAAYDRTLSVAPQPARSAARPEPDRVGDLLADLDDDAPIGGRVVLPRWLSLAPVAVFAASVAAFAVGLVGSISAALGASLALFLLSCVLFLTAPFVALLASRRGMS